MCKDVIVMKVTVKVFKDCTFRISPPLKMGQTCASFQESGKIPIRRD